MAEPPLFAAPRMTPVEVLAEALEASTTDDRCDEGWLLAVAERVNAARPSGTDVGAMSVYGSPPPYPIRTALTDVEEADRG